MAKIKAPLPTSLSSARRLLRRDKRLLIFSLFLLASMVMWLVIKLSYPYTYEVPAQVELYTLRPASHIVTDGNHAQVQLRVRARGYDLLLYKFFNNKRFRAPISEGFTLDLPTGEAGIATSQLRNAVAQQLGASYELQLIIPDSLHFSITHMAVKKVPVRSNFNLSYAPQYMQRGSTTLSPDSILVSGGESIIENISEIFTNPLTRDKVTSTLSGAIGLIAPPHTILSLNKISYNIDVERFIETSYELPIHIIGAPDSLNVQLLPNTAKVTFSITMKEYAQLKREALFLSVHYAELQQSLSNQLQVHLSNPPKYVLSTSIAPEFVNVVSLQKL